MEALSVKGLCKEYPSFSLKDVSFSVEQGTIMGFIGRNGAGKNHHAQINTQFGASKPRRDTLFRHGT